MAKTAPDPVDSVSPFSLRQPGGDVSVLTVSDEENQPGRSWTFRIKSGSRALLFHKGASMAQVLIQRYLTGTPDQTFKAIAFPAVGGEAVEISENLLEQVAHIWAQQQHAGAVPAVDDLDSIHGSVQDGMSCEEIIAMAAVAPNAWLELLAKLPKRKRGNDSTDTRGTSAE